MKKLYPLLWIVFFPNWLAAQFMTSMNISPSPALSCSTITVNLVGEKGCLNGVLNGTTSSISGNIIFVNLDVSQPFICLPVISTITGSASLTNVPPGTYSVRGRYVQNGVATDSIVQTLVVGSCCTVNKTIVSASGFKACVGDTFTFAAADPNLLSYLWKVNGTPVSTASSVILPASLPGTYTLSLAVSNGTCVDSSSRTVNVIAPQVIGLTKQDEGCPGKSNGSITSNVSLGLLPYTYSWSNGAATANLSGIPAGAYTLTVSDSVGCVSQNSITVNAGPPVAAAFIPSDTLICQGDTVQFTNTSTGSSTHLWFLGGTLVSATSNSELVFPSGGTFVVKLLALSPTCEDSLEQVIEVSQAPGVTPAFTKPSCPNATNGGISLTLSGGLPAFSFLWSNGSTASSLSQVGAGVFDLTLTDAIGCQYLNSFTLTAEAGIESSFTLSDTGFVCLGTTLQMTSTTQGATSLSWLVNGQPAGSGATASYQLAAAGVYAISLGVADAQCSDTSSVTVVVPVPAQAAAEVVGETCPGSENGAIFLTVSQGVAPYQVAWSNGATTPNITGLATGAYVVTITDNEGCETIDTIQVPVLGGLSAGFTYTYGSSGVQFQDQSGTATSWAWDFGDNTTSTDPNPVHAFPVSGTYLVCLTATDELGCRDSVCQEVSFSTGLDAQLAVSFGVYPNPAREQVMLDLSAWKQQPVEVIIRDLAGRDVLMVPATASSEVQVTVTGLPAGVYVVEVRGKSQRGTARFWKE